LLWCFCICCDVKIEAPARTAGARQEQTLTLLELYGDGCGAAGGIRRSIENIWMLWNTCAGFQTTGADTRSSRALENACVFLASEFGEDGRHGANGRTRGASAERWRRSGYSLVIWRAHGSYLNCYDLYWKVGSLKHILLIVQLVLFHNGCVACKATRRCEEWMFFKINWIQFHQ